jgi:hypothetical protein
MPNQKNKPNPVNQIKQETKQKLKENKEKKNKNSQLFQSFINHLQSVFKSTFVRVTLGLFFVFLLLFIVYSYTQHKVYQKTLVNHLPSDSTVVFLEVNKSAYLDQVKKFSKSKNYEEIQSLINLDTQILNTTELTPIIKKSTQKNVSIQIHKDKLHPLFIYKLNPYDLADISFPTQIISQKSDKKWYYTLQGDTLSISDSKEVSHFPFAKNSTPLTLNPAFQDAYQNIPIHNLGWFSLNYQLLASASNDPVYPLNRLSIPQPLVNTLGFTTGHLHVNQQGLLIGTYTNSTSNSDISFSPLTNLDKFNPHLQKELPPLQNIDLIFSGTEFSTIFEQIFQNSTTNIDLQNIATRHNLTSEDTQTVKKLLSQEYLVYKQGDSFTLLLPKQSPETQQQILNVLSRLESYFSPYINTYRLEDGSTARTLVPSPIKQKDITQSNSHEFYFQDLKQNLVVDFSSEKSDKLIYAPQSNTILLPATDIKSQQQPRPYINLLPQASSHMYLSKDEASKLFEKLSINLYPSHINSSSYFFNDGIQILFQLSW